MNTEVRIEDNEADSLASRDQFLETAEQQKNVYT